MLYDPRPASTQGVYPVIYLASDGSIRFYVSSADRITSGAGSIATGKWYHVALTRGYPTTTSFQLWVNGVPSVAFSASYTFLTSIPNIGAGYNNTASITSFFNGYMSNIRIVSGQNVYTTNIFAVPTQPLPAIQPVGQFSIRGNPSVGLGAGNNGGPTPTSTYSGIDTIVSTQTALLLNTPNTANFLTDTSTNGFTITNNGSATASSLSPFVNGPPGGAWSLQNSGTPGSLQFGQGSASSQYFKVVNTTTSINPTSISNFDFGSGDFTVELWALKQSVGAEKLISGWSTTTTQAGSWSINSSTTDFSFSYSTAGTTATSTTLTAPGTSGITVANGYWYHLAAVRSGNVFSFYINGVLAASSTNAITLQTPNTVTVGAYASGASSYLGTFNGLLSSIRVVK